MKIKMLDNAVDSIQLSITFFNKWTKCGEEYEDRLLKLVFIFLHNSIELLLKTLLIKKDEMSIYDKNQEEIIVEARRKALLLGDMTLDEYLIKDLNVKTISYNTLVQKYADMYKCDKKVKNILSELGRYRNAVTHYGIDKSEEVDEVYNVIYETFGIIAYDIFYKLKTIDKYFMYNDIIDMLEPWYEMGIDFRREIAVENSKKKINQFTNMLKNVIYSEKLKGFLDVYNIRIDDTYTNYDTNDIIIDFLFSHQLVVTVVTNYSPYFNYTFFNNIEGGIWFVVDHFNEKLYIYNDYQVYDYRHEKQTIIKDDIGVKCEEKPLTENRIRNKIIDMLKKELLID